MKYSLSFDEILRENENPNVNLITVSDRIDILDDYYHNGFPKGQPSGIRSLNKYFSWVPGFVYCFTGYPGSGKSEILKYLSVLRVDNSETKVVMYSPESNEIELMDDLARMYLGKNTNKNYDDQCSIEEYQMALNWVNEHYAFLQFETMPTVQTLLDEYSKLIDTGFNFFITDPFNYVAEGSSDDGMGISRYLKTALSSMKTFAVRNKVINVIVEHPNQPKPNPDGSVPKVTQFRINGGAMWNNKMDCIVGITRDWDSGLTDFETLKMKSQRYNGVPGCATIKYDIKTGRYNEMF